MECKDVPLRVRLLKTTMDEAVHKGTGGLLPSFLLVGRRGGGGRLSSSSSSSSIQEPAPQQAEDALQGGARKGPARLARAHNLQKGRQGIERVHAPSCFLLSCLRRLPAPGPVAEGGEGEDQGVGGGVRTAPLLVAAKQGQEARDLGQHNAPQQHHAVRLLLGVHGLWGGGGRKGLEWVG